MNTIDPPFPLLTPHFGGSECMVNKHGYSASIPQEHWDNLMDLAEFVLEPWRALVGPITINRMYADDHLNELQGGVKTSDHRLGKAADCVPNGLHLSIAYEKLVRSKIDFDQAIIYPERGFIHVSYRAGANRREMLFNPYSKTEANTRAANKQKVYYSYNTGWIEFYKQKRMT